MLSGPKGYRECDKCINGEYDPEQCETCDAGSNFEAYDDEVAGDDNGAVEDIEYRDFIKIWRNQS